VRVYVTKELYPFSSGGIGRVIGNLLQAASPCDRKEMAVLWLGESIDADKFGLVYPGVRLITAPMRDFEIVDPSGRRMLPLWAYTNTEWHWMSVNAMQALSRFEKVEGPIDYIEFPDWGGLGFATIQEKRLGLAFDGAIIGVRLHSTDGVIGAHENVPRTLSSLSIFDIERKALADCDLLIAQVQEVANRMRDFYGFNHAEWDSRVILDPPVVLLTGRGYAKKSIEPQYDTPILFTSKIQSVKRPQVFIRGCVGFLEAASYYKGNIVFCAHAPDKSYLNSLKKMIPKRFEGRFVFLEEMGEVERNELIARSVCVVTSAWESFCLAAFEASLAGAVVVANKSNPAFSPGSSWNDGENCVMFDGTSAGLSEALQSVWRHPRCLSVVQVQTSGPRTHSEQRLTAEQKSPLVSVLIPHFNLGRYLVRTLISALEINYPNLEVVVVDDGSTDDFSLERLHYIESLQDERVRVVHCGGNRGLSGARNFGMQHVRGDYVLTLDADDLIDPSFVGLAVRGLERNPDFDFVVPQTAFFTDEEESGLNTMKVFSDYAAFHGDARAAGLHENRFSTATCLSRASVLRRYRYREELESYEDWDLYLRAATDGCRFLVTNGVHFFYRRRPNSMIHSPEARSRGSQLYHDLLRDKALDIGAIKLPLSVVSPAIAVKVQECSAPVAEHVPALINQAQYLNDMAELERFRRSGAVRIAVRVSRTVRRTLPMLHSSLGKWMRRQG
jgi:glycosyltransferase involved in cell wall biosynthesis